MESGEQIRTIRIDVPLLSTCAYLFVDSGQTQEDPWWADLYRYLLSLRSDRLEWEYEPVQDVHLARPQLTNEQREGVLRFLRTAPRQEIEGHRTLRRAIELAPDRVARLDIMYFSGHPRSEA